MLTALAWLSLAQAVAIAPPPQAPPLIAAVPPIEGTALPRIPNEFTSLYEVRPLPGQLDATPVFNSNSPELIQQEGILLSTFPADDMANGDAHLDFSFEGRFDFFAHHIARGVAYDDRRTLFVGGVIYNPNDEPVTISIEQGVSYLSQDAPFYDLPALRMNPNGEVFAGPGSRTVTDFLQGRGQSQWPRRVVIPPERAYLLLNAPIPLRRLPFAADATLPPGSILPGAPITNTVEPVASVIPQGDTRELPSYGRSLLLHMSSDAPVYAATLAMYAPRTLEGQERAPTLQEWLALLVNGDLAGPRDIAPSNPEAYQESDRSGRFFYGRVAGVAEGSQWAATAADSPDGERLTIPRPGEAIAYVLSTVDYNTFGTQQIQSAPMLARYPDTAYRAHGNYGVHYNVKLPLYNNSDSEQRIILRLQTPLQDETLPYGLRFLRNPPNRIFFRGTVRVQYQTASGQKQTRYVHLVQRQGDEGEPLLRITLPPQTQNNVVVDLIYPPDATPPQVLTVSTAGIANTRVFDQPEAVTPATATDEEAAVEDAEAISDPTAEAPIESLGEDKSSALAEDPTPDADSELNRSMNEAAVESDRP